MSIFSKVSLRRPKYSKFNLSHNRKFSLNMGDLVPMFVQEVLPGSTYKVNTAQVLRMMPMLSPVMHEVNVITHFFFVPNRIIWEGWEEFITGGVDGLANRIMPAATQLDVQPGSLADYLGLPITNPDYGVTDEPISLLPFFAYKKIYDDYYRDQNLQPTKEINQKTSKDGVNTADEWNGNDFFPGLFDLKKRAWQHDYFTSALPWAQKGQPVRLPLLGDADVEYIPGNGTILRSTTGVPPAGGWDVHQNNGKLIRENYPDAPLTVDNSANLKVNLDDATSTTVNDLRTAIKVQEWLEKNARAGSRYVESILAHFGVTSSDARLQRPEFLGGGLSPMMISEVLQTSESQSTPLAEMGGHGLNLGRNHSFKRRFEEHGYIIGIVSVMPKTAYQQGIPRHFSKFDKFDFAYPEFAHLGEQEIKNKELLVTDDLNHNNGTFGYIPRYSEYRYIPNTVHGEMATSLNFWHMGRIFENPPQLNADFIKANPTKRIFAVESESEHSMVCMMEHTVSAILPLPYHSDPSFR